MKVLIGYEFSGRVRDAFLAAGHDAYSVDLEPTESSFKKHHWVGYIQRLFDQPDLIQHWDLGIFFPPCTYLASSGARWIKRLGRVELRDKAVEEVKWLASLPIKRIAIENPIGCLSTLWRKPDQIIHPWMFGHGETKATCLWLKNLPLLEPTKIVSGRVARVHHEPPSPERWKNRSRMLEGIAEAMAVQWGKLVD